MACLHTQADVNVVSAAIVTVLNGLVMWLLGVSLLPAFPRHLLLITLMFISWHICKNLQSCGSSNSSSAKTNVCHAYLQASMRAILNANYMAKRLEQSYPVLYKGKNGTCAHEFILDIRSLKDSAGTNCVAKCCKLAAR